LNATVSTSSIPRSIKLFYGVGQYGEGITIGAYYLFLLFYYNQVLGLSGSLAGLAGFLALGTDAISDPLVGHLSDRVKSRWGRRHPFMYASAVPIPLFFYLLFVPPSGLGQLGLFTWMAVFTILTRQSITLFQTPYYALGAELSSDFEERNSIVAHRIVFQRVGSAMAGVLGLMVFLRPTAEFENGQFNQAAYPPLALTIALMAFVAIIMSTRGTHSHIPRLTTRENLVTRRPILSAIVNDMREALRMRSFRILFLASMIASVGWGLVESLLMHMATYFWHIDTQVLFLFGVSSYTGMFFGISYWTRVASRTDKKPVYVRGLGLFIAFTAVPYACHALGLFPARDSAFFLPLYFLVVGMMANFCIASIMVTGPSMMADVTDEDELRHGRRREGIFFGSMSFIAKASVGVGVQLSGLLLDLVGLVPGTAPEEVTAAVGRNLGLAYVFAVVLIVGASLLVISRFDLTRERHREIQARLRETKAR
jgi:Na+/melibiose symporter-like transporter